MPHILVCADGSYYSDSVYDHAAWAAHRTGGTLEVLHVLDHKRDHADTADWSGNMSANAREALLEQLADLDAQKSKVLQTKGRAVLDAAATHLTGSGLPKPKLTLRNGSFIETVAEVEENADLVVIGKRGEEADLAAGHLGANLERVVRGSQHPVLVTSRAFRPVQKVMIACDAGPSARKAVRHAAEGDLLKDLDILVLRVGPDNQANRDAMTGVAETLWAAGRQARTRIENGSPEEVIARVAEEEGIDLLVVGAYGHSRIRQFIVGSTTTTLIRKCRIPLLMFR